MSERKSILSVSGLQKSFGAIQAVRGISFEVGLGECVGLLGPNGAGKTTTISMITGLVKPDAGEILIEGARRQDDTDPVKRKIGLVPQELALYEPLTSLQNLRLFGSLYGLEREVLAKRIDAALGLVGLKERMHQPVKEFSGGMKRRLNIAASLLHEPQILLLDEPTVGVDPQSRNAIFDNIAQLREQGKTIVYTTHYMEEVERLCDRVIIVDHGKVVADDTIPGLKRRLAGKQMLAIGISASKETGWLEELKSIPGVEGVEFDAELLRMGISNLELTMPQVLDSLRKHGVGYHHLETESPDLEAAFLQLTGHSLRD